MIKSKCVSFQLIENNCLKVPFLTIDSLLDFWLFWPKWQWKTALSLALQGELPLLDGEFTNFFENLPYFPLKTTTYFRTNF